MCCAVVEEVSVTNITPAFKVLLTVAVKSLDTRSYSRELEDVKLLTGTACKSKEALSSKCT